jgi:hypothetical protein
MDSGAVYHGFLRAPSGKFTIIDAPGAGTIPWPGGTIEGTQAYGMNPAGVVMGYYRDTSNIAYGYLRYPDGAFKTFHDPNASETAWRGTQAFTIDPGGAVAGTYIEADNSCHGYVRTRDGRYTTFDAPDAGTGGYPRGTWPSGMTPAGEIAGFYVDANYFYHGFLRDPFGAITQFDPSGSLFTYVLGINPEGVIVGTYCDAIACHGFLLPPDGKFTTVDAPFLGAAGAWASSINDVGAITGYYWDASGVNHGFLRTPGGKFLTFDAPNAGTESGQGTFPTGINPFGAITGDFLDVGNTYHGFLIPVMP